MNTAVKYNEIYAEIVEITPEIAGEWLEKNIGNRPLSKAAIEKYASDIRSGHWSLNHQGIAFDKKGNLADGQHRLYAIIKTGVSVRSIVVYGVDRSGIDENRVRSKAFLVSQIDADERYQDVDMSWFGKREAETINQMMVFFVDPQKRPTASEIYDFAIKNKDAVIFASRSFSASKAGISTAAARAVIACAYYSFNEKSLYEFVRCLYTGMIKNDNQSAAIKARDMLMSGGFSGGATIRKKTALKLMHAIKKFIKEEPISILVEPKNVPFSLPDARK